MSCALLFAVLTTPILTPDEARLARTELVAQAPKGDAEYEKKKAEAGEDPTKLWKLYEWCRDTKREKESKLVLKKILKIDPNHKDANVASGNIFYDGKWFASQKKIDEYKHEKEAAENKAKGLVEWKGQWVAPADVPFLEKGLVRDDNGNWVDPESAQKLADGWVKQDLTWIPAAEKDNVAKNLWKCGDQWLSIADADKYHSEIEQWWTIPFDHFHLYTTLERDLASQQVKRQLDAAWVDLKRVFDDEPKAPVIVIVLRDSTQYGSYAAGDEDKQRQGTDSQGLSSVHHAYFADGAQDPQSGAFLRAGVGFWDASTSDGPKWGVHSVRYAIGQSFAEALDPSPKAEDAAINPKKKMSPKQFWESYYDEKRMPAWFRCGAATYAERYFKDLTVGKDGDQWWARKWSAANIHAHGGLRALKQIFEFDIKPGDPQDSDKLMNESGLVVAYALDGGNAAVTAKFKDLQTALKTGKDKKAVAAASTAFEAEVAKNEADLKKFGGL